MISKKKYNEYCPTMDRPEIVTVGKADYPAVLGKGDPNEESGIYREAIGILYAPAHKLKMSRMTGHRIEGSFDYVVPPLEGSRRQDGMHGIDYGNKSEFRRISLTRLPDFVTRGDFDRAVKSAEKKRRPIAPKRNSSRWKKGIRHHGFEYSVIRRDRYGDIE